MAKNSIELALAATPAQQAEARSVIIEAAAHGVITAEEGIRGHYAKADQKPRYSKLLLQERATYDPFFLYTQDLKDFANLEQLEKLARVAKEAFYQTTALVKNPEATVSMSPEERGVRVSRLLMHLANKGRRNAVGEKYKNALRGRAKAISGKKLGLSESIDYLSRAGTIVDDGISAT